MELNYAQNDAQSGDDHDAANKTSQSAHPSQGAPPTNHSVVDSNNQLEETKLEDTPTLPADIHSSEDPAVPSNNQGQRTRTKFTTRQKLIFLSATLASFSNWLTYCVISVFFPVQAKARGMSQTVIGLVFSTFAISSSIGSPIWGKALPILGARFVFLAGAFVIGICNVLFGFVADMPTEATFTAFCFIIRVVEGLGSSACVTSTFAIVSYTFPNHVGTAVSIIEMMAGLAIGLGPAVGGLLYDAGGFKLPFFTLGGVVLLIFCVNFFLMPNIGTSSEKAGSITQVLSIPATWVTMFAIFVACLGIAFMDPTLSLHLKQLDYTVVERSLLFGSLGATYALTSILWGRIADLKKCTRIMIVLGLFGTGVYFLLIGPSPLLKIPPNKVLPVIAIPFGACSLALIGMPTLLDLFISAEWYGLTVDLGLTGIISGLWASGFSTGAILGPIIAGALTERFGFNWATTFVAGGYIVVMVCTCLFGAWEYRCGKGRRLPRSRLDPGDNATEEEKAQLLPNDA